MATQVYVRVYDTRIMALGNETGMVGQYVLRKSEAIERFAQASAPKRTTRLARSIHLNFRHRGHQTYGSIGTSLYYARWVHDGTATPITPKRKRYMRVPVAPRARKRMNRRRVRGQAPQPFLTDSLEFVMGGSRFLSRL